MGNRECSCEIISISNQLVSNSFTPYQSSAPQLQAPLRRRRVAFIHKDSVTLSNKKLDIVDENLNQASGY